MTGTILVTSSSGEPPPPPPPDPGADDGNAQDAYDGTSSSAVVLQKTAVSIIDNAYNPEDLIVNVGDSVTWTNNGELPHTVTATDESFDSGFLMNGDEWSFRFDGVGEFEYLCTIHPEMVGRIIVTTASPLDDSTDAATVTAEGTTISPTDDGDEEADLDLVAATRVPRDTSVAVFLLALGVLAVVGSLVMMLHAAEFSARAEGT
jgi:plastocyanin